VAAGELAQVERELVAAESTRPRDEAALASALQRAIELCRSEPAADDYFVLPELLGDLADTWEALGRPDDAIEAMREAIAAGWRGAPDGRCRIAEILMRSGRVAEAAPIWAQVRLETPEDVWLYNVAGLEYAAIGDHSTALEWLTAGLALALDSDDPERLVGQLADLRLASLAEVGSGPDDLQATAEAFLAQPRRKQTRHAVPRLTFEGDPAAFAGQAVTEIAWAWFPASEYAEALRRWPELTEPGGPAAGGRSHAAYCRAMESGLRTAADAGMTGLEIAPLHLDEFSAWCETRDTDRVEARAGYAAELARARDPRLVSWPPARNGLCWCGSRRKKKKCCGTPGSASG
jgi:tetratricopeptide (TPR) repeat protein